MQHGELYVSNLIINFFFKNKNCKGLTPFDCNTIPKVLTFSSFFGFA